MANNGQQSLWALCWKQDRKPLPQGQYWSRFNLIRNPWEIRWGWHCSALQSTWVMTKMASHPVYDSPSGYVGCAADGWMVRLRQEDVWSNEEGITKRPWSRLIQPRSPKWQLKSFILTLVNKTMSLLFRLHLSERAMFDESTAVIVGVRHK